MLKFSNVLIIILLTAALAVSGCTNKTATNGTFGEKNISLDNINVLNNVTADHNNFNGTEYYYINGYIKNNNKYDVFKVKIIATAYDANGTVVAVNNTPYINPDNIPSNDISWLYVTFLDPQDKIVKYDIKIVDASGTFN